MKWMLLLLSRVLRVNVLASICETVRVEKKREMKKAKNQEIREIYIEKRGSSRLN